MKRRIHSGLGFFVCLLVLAFSFLPSINFVSTVKAQEPQQNLFFDAHPDWKALWILFNQHAMWDLEWYNSTSLEWVSIQSDLTIQKIYPKNDTCKITLNFNASQTGNYRLTFAIDARVRNYVNKTDKYQYELDYDDYSIVFDWTDVISIPNLMITHGLTMVDGNDYFWFRMRRDNIPKGAHVVIDPTVAFTTVSVTSVHTCPLDTHTFVIAYHDETNDDFSFQIYDTNGTQVLAETDVDTTSGGAIDRTSVGVSAFNSTTFVIGWWDKTDADVTFAVYNKTGSLLSGPTDADTDVGSYCRSVQVSCFNSTHFVIAWNDNAESDVTFAVYDSSSNLIAGPADADMDAGNFNSVSVSTFNSTCFVIGWYDRTDGDATFAIYNSVGTQIGADVDVDTDVSYSFSVSVSTLNSTHFVMGWFDLTDQDATFAVYDSSGTLKAGPTDADTTAGTTSSSVQISALNSTVFVISWYDYVDFDLSFATYLSDGTAVAALTDIESWPTAANDVFQFQSPCSQETGTGIKLYSDNWIIAYANTTTQADWKAFMPNGTVWDGTIPSGPSGQDLTFPLSQSILISAYNALAKELGFQSSSLILPSSMGYFWKSLPFQVTGGINFYESTNIYRALAFLSSGVISFFSSLSKGVGLGFQPSVSTIPSSTSYFTKAIGFQATSMAQSLASVTMQKAIGFLSTGVTNIFSTLSKGMALSFQPSSMILSSSTGYFWKAIGLQPTGSIKAYDSGAMQKAIGFLSAGTTNIYSTILRGIELGFTPTGILYPFAYGTSGKETATILVDRFELAKIFDNAEMLKALSFRTTGSINLFDSSAMSKAIGLLTSGTINLYDASALLKAKGFLAVNNINLFSTVLRGVEVAFQSAGTVRFWGSDSMLKALGFQSSDSIRLFDGNFFGKGLLFQATQTINVFAGFQVAKEQLFTILNVFHYEPVYPSASLIQNKAVQFSVLGEITKMFSSLSSNLGREFFNYDLIHPSANMMQNKAVQFGVDGLARLFSDASLSVGRNFIPFERVNPFAYLNMNKTLEIFNIEQIHLFDNLGIGKELAVVLVAAFNLVEPVRVSDGFSAFGTFSLYPPSLPVTVSLYPALQPSILDLKPILIVESYMPTFISNVKAFYIFLFTMNYPAHIQVVCAPPATSTVDINAITVVTVPELNYTTVLRHTISGNQSITEDVTIPLPFMNQQGSYIYQVSTIYMYGDTLITQSSTEGTLTVQSWWVWMWAGLVAGLILSFIGITVGGYKLHERKQKNKLKLQKAQKTCSTAQENIVFPS